jgi:hypothetical protein
VLWSVSRVEFWDVFRTKDAFCCLATSFRIIRSSSNSVSKFSAPCQDFKFWSSCNQKKTKAVWKFDVVWSQRKPPVSSKDGLCSEMPKIQQYYYIQGTSIRGGTPAISLQIPRWLTLLIWYMCICVNLSMRLHAVSCRSQSDLSQISNATQAPSWSENHRDLLVAPLSPARTTKYEEASLRLNYIELHCCKNEHQNTQKSAT